MRLYFIFQYLYSSINLNGRTAEDKDIRRAKICPKLCFVMTYLDHTACRTFDLLQKFRSMAKYEVTMMLFPTTLSNTRKFYYICPPHFSLWIKGIALLYDGGMFTPFPQWMEEPALQSQIIEQPPLRPIITNVFQESIF